MLLPIAIPNTCPTLEAGSVLTNNTLRPESANEIAAAQANEVLPTPPLPVKNKNLGELLRNLSLLMAKVYVALATTTATTRLGFLFLQ